MREGESLHTLNFNKLKFKDQGQLKHSYKQNSKFLIFKGIYTKCFLEKSCK